jgi:hypothetical protein
MRADAEGFAQGRGIEADEAAFGQCRRGDEAGVVARQAGLGDPAVGRRDPVDPGKGQFPGEPVLQCPEGPLRAAPGPGRTGGAMVDPMLRQRPAQLRRAILVNLAAHFWGVRTGTAPVGAEAGGQAPDREGPEKALNAKKVRFSSTRKAEQIALVASSSVTTRSSGF